MHRFAVHTALDAYFEKVMPLFASKAYFSSFACTQGGERDTWQRFKDFVSEQPQCFDAASYVPGHCTGSALILNRDGSRVVLTLHGKLQKWLQLGGHADGQGALHLVALREAREESGLNHLRPVAFGHGEGCLDLPFDLDIHPIPARKGQPAHLHFDARYLFVAEDEGLVISDESLDLRWFTWQEARAVCAEESMQRQFAKVAYLRERSLLTLSP